MWLVDGCPNWTTGLHVAADSGMLRSVGNGSRWTSSPVGYFNAALVFTSTSTRPTLLLAIGGLLSIATGIGDREALSYILLYNHYTDYRPKGG